MIKSWQPLLDRLLVLQDWGPEFHPGTEVAIPEPLRAKQRPNTGTIVDVGPGQYVNGTFCPVALKTGQQVMFAPAETLTPVEHCGVEHLMMREVDVFLVLNEPTKATTRPQNIFDAIRDVQTEEEGSLTITGELSLAEEYALTNMGYSIKGIARAGSTTTDETVISWPGQPKKPAVGPPYETLPGLDSDL